MKSILSLILCAAIFSLIACTKDSTQKYSEIPAIELRSISDRTLHFFDTAGMFRVLFQIKDGDGDIGRTLGNDSAIIFQDIRSDTVYQTFNLPFPIIPSEYTKKEGLLANTTVQLPTPNIVPRPDSLHTVKRTDTMIARIRVRDDAGNISNTLETVELYIVE